MIGNYNTEQFAKLILDDFEGAKEEILNHTIRAAIKLTKCQAQTTCLRRLEWKLKGLLNKCEGPMELLECVMVEYREEIASFILRAKEVNFKYEELL